MSNWKTVIRFIAEEDGQEHFGDINSKEFPDVGLATFEGKKVTANAIDGSIFDGKVTDRILTVNKVCCSNHDITSGAQLINHPAH